jgi:two-component system sensor histidine kinase PilS (NtrC family)
LYAQLKSLHLTDGLGFEFTANSKYQVDVQVKYLITPQQALTLLILQDTQKIRQQVQQLKLAALGQLSASIAHEIRNPLAAISQANELLKDSSAEQHIFLTDMIGRQSERINNIIEDTLAMARNRQTTPMPLMLNRLLPEMLEQDLNDARSRIFLDLQPESQIYFDEIQFRQVLINLIRNALRYNPLDEPIHVRSTKQEKLIFLDVIDFGQGVAKQDIAQLFTPFFSTEINGTGLGLYLSHSFCEANKARLTYVEQEKGACFRIECPTI